MSVTGTAEVLPDTSAGEFGTVVPEFVIVADGVLAEAVVGSSVTVVPEETSDSLLENLVVATGEGTLGTLVEGSVVVVGDVSLDTPATDSVAFAFKVLSDDVAAVVIGTGVFVEDEGDVGDDVVDVDDEESTSLDKEVRGAVGGLFVVVPFDEVGSVCVEGVVDDG